MNLRTYNLIILIPLALLLVVFTVLGVIMQPLSGDLTRLGGYTENDFGWTYPQETFKERLFDTEASSNYKKYYDIVVLGDSFSFYLPKSQWQNYLIQLTGLKIVGYHLDKLNINEFLSSPAFIKTPPKIIIFETVERSFNYRGKQIGLDGDCKPRFNLNYSQNPISVKAAPYSLQSHSRDTTAGLLHPNIRTAVHYLKRNIKMIFNKKSIRTYQFPLKQNSFFSNRLSDSLLVYRDDVLKLQKNRETVSRSLCKILNLQNRIQDNGKTFFITLLAPDKLTAYSRFLKTDKFINNSWYNQITSAQLLNIPPLKIALETAIGNTVKDIYLPDDTHWGSAGHKITAETLNHYLLENKIIISNN